MIVFARCTAGEWTWTSSDQVTLEIGRTPDAERRERLLLAATNAQEVVPLQPHHFDRASELVALGFRPADALHVACAEAGNVDVLLTTDDQLIRRSRRVAARLMIRVANPLEWLAEIVHQ